MQSVAAGMCVQVASRRNGWLAGSLAGLVLLAGCSNSNKGTSSAVPTEAAATSGPITATVRATRTGTVAAPGFPFGSPTAAIGTATALPGQPNAPATATTSPASNVSQADLPRLALQGSDLPSGFILTDSGPGGPELGRDVTASFQEEFQQRDVTSTQSLQQTIVVVNLLGQYKDATSAADGVKSVTTQTLGQVLGSNNLSVEPAAVSSIGEDTVGYHITGNTANISFGGYLIVFHRGPTAAMVVTAAVKGSESLSQTVSLAQRQDQKLQSGG